MTNNFESDIKYVPYKEFVKRRALDYYYYYGNKEIISEKNKNKYKSLSPEQKKRDYTKR